ncbi:MFS transporter [Streptomyces sp. P9(2023)]|uniref:MFS transporter n=1 Tax=Streptomyces sp. P9(2023) TaxID=3064394 RepID=UPI0028F41DF8|nr:MFS transporter [Streptomyces sp. P9(2023)]MDT9687038.1 MFS transporter [Streptomyces sp. P9(2023)]
MTTPLSARLRSWLPAGRSARRLIAASFVDSVGTGLFIAGSALFFTRGLGLSTIQVGVGLSLAGLAGFLGMVPLGRLADGIGAKKAIVALYTWRGLCFAVYPFAAEPAFFYVIAFLIGIAEWGGGPIVQSIVGAVEGDAARVRTMAVIATVRNVGFSLGAVLAAGALATESTRAFSGLVFADAVTFFAAAVLLSRLPAVANVRAGRAKADRPGMKVHDPRFLALAVLNGVLFLHTVLLTAALPLWISTRTDAPPAVIGVVVVLNTGMVVLTQVRLSGGSTDLRSAARRQQWSGLCLAACCVLVALAAQGGAVTATVLLLAATAALTLGEIWQSVGAWRLSYALSPKERRGTYLSVYELGTSGASAAGPVLITWGVIENGAAGWVGLAGCFVLTGFAIVLIAGRAGRAQATAANQQPAQDETESADETVAAGREASRTPADELSQER